MDSLSDQLQQAFALLLTGDGALWEIIGLSLKVSLSAVIIAVIVGLPLAVLLTMARFNGDRLLRILVDTSMALPPVVVGLVVYLLLSRAGPLGIWSLLYTPSAMIIAQALLITPLVIALSLPILNNHWQAIGDQLIMLGITRRRSLLVLLHEAKLPLVTVMLAAFGRAIAEIGAVMVVGGNIEHHTRVMTTTIAMETQQGNLQLALALGIVLIFIALLVNSSVHIVSTFQQRALLASTVKANNA